MPRLIKYVKLHGKEAFYPDVGSLGDTLPPFGKSFKSFQMSHTPEGVLLELTTNLGKNVDVIVPWANVQVAVLDKKTEEKAAVETGLKVA
jgi:hypothetical protein